MDHINSVQAALRAAAPVVAIPVEGHAPVCVKRKLLAGALKGVTIDSVEIVTGITGSVRWLKIKGHAGTTYPTSVRTSCSILAVEQWKALQEIHDWAAKERDCRLKIAKQGVLSTQEQRALKLKQAEKAHAQELIERLREAQANLVSIRERVRDHIRPGPKHFCDSERDKFMAYHRTRHLRKRASIILYEIAKLRKESESMTVKRKAPHKPIETALRRGKSAGDLLGILSRIGALESQYKALFPPIWEENPWAAKYNKGRIRQVAGHWVDSYPAKHPHKSIREEVYLWHNDYQREEIARELRSALATVKALTPPQEQEPDELPIAA